ncbi:hypothetical protein OP10G_4595 [Fimbriimonas ginsengisoli Gsoil 348]|uniref:Uncharacterized protein n=1 Tax=Fimbriimonas ginsengisoli Gsoil 348 TaxID=661478 RepID=A0A068NWR8_FIMGI|nr:hypothetical protein OP10G_4595 [Fimbriimonas ginsengisoli Gsoil 348]
MCSRCNRAKGFGDPSYVLNPSGLDELAERVASPQPIRVCDDAETWDWRAYLTRRNHTHP